MCTTWVLLNVTCDVSLALDITLLTITFADLPNYDTIVLDAATTHNSLIVVTESNTQHICKSSQSANFINKGFLTCAMSCVFPGSTRPSRYWVVEQLYLAFSPADDNQRVRVRTAQHIGLVLEMARSVVELPVARLDMVESGVARPNARHAPAPHTGPGIPRHVSHIHSRALPHTSTSKCPAGSGWQHSLPVTRN